MKDEVKELKKTEVSKQKMFKLQCAKYNEQLKELDIIRMDTTKNITAIDKVRFG